MGDGYKKRIILCSVLALGIIAISVIFALSDKKEKSPVKTGTAEATGIPESHDYSATEAMITEIDLDSSTIKLEELNSGTEYELTFTGASDIRTKTGRAVSAAVLSKGNIVKISFDSDNRLKSLYGHDGVWSYPNIENIRITKDISKIEVGSRVYRYNSCLKVLDSGEFKELDSVITDGTDVVDLYGIGEYVYLIRINSGHGYLTLSNAEDFIGGTISYGIGKRQTVDEELKLTLREGDYDITVENNGYDATATVRIRNNETTVFDLTGYGPEPVEYGEVTFVINPEDADLYIDGIKTAYKEPVELPLGYHEIEAVLGGYTDYRGSIEVGLEGVVKKISLSPAPTPVPQDVIYEDDPEEENEDEEDPVTAAPSPTGNGSGSGSSDSGIKISVIPGGADDEDDPDYSDIELPDSTTDSEDDTDIEVIDGDEPDDTEDEKKSFGQIIVYCTEGTDIYINGEFKGTIKDGNFTTDKPSGIIELELRKEGYVTKKYTLTMDDDEEKQVYKFPAMTPDSSG